MFSSEITSRIDQQILSPEFYRQDFQDMESAADFLGASEAELASLLSDEYETTMPKFLISMRIEDVREHLNWVNSRESLLRLAALYGFRSRLHLLWCFIRQEKCTPRMWARKMGCLTPDNLACNRNKEEGGI